MQTIALSVKNLNVSLQVGDAIYAAPTRIKPNAVDQQTATNSEPVTGAAHLVGILRRISTSGNATILKVDNSFAHTGLSLSRIAGPGDFLMFSKHDQTDGDVNGYYAKANFMNDSREKAELFAVSSEIVINSK